MSCKSTNQMSHVCMSISFFKFGNERFRHVAISSESSARLSLTHHPPNIKHGPTAHQNHGQDNIKRLKSNDLASGGGRSDGAVGSGNRVAVALPGGEFAFDFCLAMVVFISHQHQCDKAGSCEQINPKPWGIRNRWLRFFHGSVCVAKIVPPVYSFGNSEPP